MKYLLLIVFGLLLTGCASFQEAYYVDQEFGVASEAAWKKQIAVPAPSLADRVPMGGEGVIAEEIMGVYNGTFADKPMKQSVLSFGLPAGQ